MPGPGQGGTALHGGSIELRSEPGTGSRFTVRIPMDAVVAGAAADADLAAVEALGEGDGASSAGRTVSLRAFDAHGVDDVQTSLPEDAADDTAAEDHERPTVLVVEDNADLRAYMRRHMDEEYRVLEAADGRAGLIAARSAVPDLILCDIMMPGMDGEQLCRAIRADPELAYLPVIMVTARASRQSRLSALEGGADDYLVKPFDPEELRLRVGNALASRRRLAERLLADGKPLPFVPLELPTESADRDFARQFEALLRERMGDEEFDVDGMADALAMSRATLYRKAEEALGTSPMDLLWTFRLDQAAHWLRETDGTVSEIAYASGFKTVPHFSRRFKVAFGATPAAYRKRA